ncbi:hypothetical protein LUA82_04755 [Neoehrlichia mikurensis]|nr:hypothetical protein [Neoehrlichia mikurensis]UTO55447.1 hypothetical protein LUA82_04755 [Neoehrlichia mikurensis]
MKKNYLHISTILNKQKSNTNYKINIDINDNQNQSFIVKDLSININNIKNYYNVKINIPNITLNNKYFNILVNGNVLFPIFNALINNKFFIYDGLITFKINNYKNALKFLFEQFNNITIPNIDLSLPSHYLENIYKTLYEAANVKDNNNIAITLKGNTSNNTLLIGSLSYEEFLAKILVNTSTHKKE